MGLRLVAHYYDRIDALIAFSVVDAAGIPVFLESQALLTVDPAYACAIGGFRLVVCEQDVEAAVAALLEARDSPLREGEALKTEFDLLNGVLSFAVGLLAGAPAAIRGRKWE
jgi:hypothetical protein